jgi:hypothetical protein
MDMIVNVIYDNRHSEDYERLLKEFSEQGITDFKFWDCIVDKDSVVKSINASHKMIVRWAKEMALEEVCIIELDCSFTCKTSWEYFIKNKPEKFDVYLSCSYLPQDLICGFHCYIVSENFYSQFLSVPDNEHIDTAICNLKGDYKFCKPYIALQRPGFSANNKSVVNYNEVLQKEDIYLG